MAIEPAGAARPGPRRAARKAFVLPLLAALALLANAPAVHADPVVAAVGDIACKSSVALPTSCRQMATSDLVAGMDPLDGVLALGDLQYECGELANFQTYYDPSWGRVKDKTYPVPGNHEYQTSGCLAGTTGGAGGYFTYFGDAATPREPGCIVSCMGYYSFDLGAWHIVALNSNCGKIGGCAGGSPQETWLRNDLAATTQSCILAYWHHPRFASTGGASTNVQGLWAALYDGGADLVLNGHTHNYERFDRLGRGTPGSSEPTVDLGGMRELIVGTGGRSHAPFKTIRAGSQVRNDQTFGVLELALHQGSYDWEFLPEAGSTFSDSGTDTCRGSPRPPPPPDTEPPSPPSDLSATPAGPSRVELSWTSATDNVGVASYGVYRDGQLIGTATSTSFADRTAQPATTYEYAVDAADAAGNRSGPSLPATATTPSLPTPPVFRSGSFTSSSRKTQLLTVTTPAGVAVGDVMVASIDVRAAPAITPPPGWTPIRIDVNGAAMTKATYYRVVEAGEPTSHAWGFSLAKAAAGGIVAYGGVDTTAPIDASGGLVNPASKVIKAPSISTTEPQARLLGFFGTASGTTVTPPVGMSELGDVASTTGASDVTSEAADRIHPEPGATGLQKATAAKSGASIGHLVALRPAE